MGDEGKRIGRGGGDPKKIWTRTPSWRGGVRRRTSLDPTDGKRFVESVFGSVGGVCVCLCFGRVVVGVDRSFIVLVSVAKF